MNFIYLKDGSFVRADVIKSVRALHDEVYGARLLFDYEVGGQYHVSISYYEFMDECLKAARDLVEEIEAITGSANPTKTDKRPANPTNTDKRPANPTKTDKRPANPTKTDKRPANPTKTDKRPDGPPNKTLWDIGWENTFSKEEV